LTFEPVRKRPVGPVPEAGASTAVVAGAEAPASLKVALLDYARNVAATIFALIVSGVPLGLIALFVKAARGGAAATKTGVSLTSLGLGFSWIGISAWLVYFWRNRATAEERSASGRAIRNWRVWGWIAAAVTFTLAVNFVVETLGRALGIEIRPSNLAPIRQALAASPAFVFVFAVLLAPAYEELLFRRVLFGRLWALGRPGLGMLLSGAGFALAHEMPGLDPRGWPATALLWLIYGTMGATLAWLYRRTGTLWAPIAAHAANNAVALSLAVALAAGQGAG
jgi:membrane protease YdiL (CAAX protease family)